MNTVIMTYFIGGVKGLTAYVAGFPFVFIYVVHVVFGLSLSGLSLGSKASWVSCIIINIRFVV